MASGTIPNSPRRWMFSSIWSTRFPTAIILACSTTLRTRSSPATIRSRSCERRARVVSMHASDRSLAEGTTLDDLRQNDGTLGYSPNLRHGVTGKGLNDYDSIFRILAEHHYQGWVSIEDGMNGMDEMAESLAFLRRTSVSTFPIEDDR